MTIDFVSPQCQGLEWDPKADRPPHPDTFSLHTNRDGGTSSWTLQTYCYLKRYGLDVRLTDRFSPGRVCVAHIDDFNPWTVPCRSYIILVRADRPPVLCANHVIVQNGLANVAERETFIPLWPQPALLPREESRGTRVENIAYLGRVVNLADNIRSNDFAEKLSQRGMNFVLRSDPRGWPDYSDIDVVVAMRGIQSHWLKTKPATKLYNAWLAGVPALLGPEPAFQELRQSELDYIEVATAQHVIDALERLSSDSQLYKDMVENGLRRAKGFSVEAICKRWQTFFDGPVTEGYQRWKRCRRLMEPFRIVKFGAALIQERRARKAFLSGTA